jgi:hypothetical protein
MPPSELDSKLDSIVDALDDAGVEEAFAELCKRLDMTAEELQAFVSSSHADAEKRERRQRIVAALVTGGRSIQGGAMPSKDRFAWAARILMRISAWLDRVLRRRLGLRIGRVEFDDASNPDASEVRAKRLAAPTLAPLARHSPSAVRERQSLLRRESSMLRVVGEKTGTVGRLSDLVYLLLRRAKSTSDVSPVLALVKRLQARRQKLKASAPATNAAATAAAATTAASTVAARMSSVLERAGSVTQRVQSSS